MSEDEQKSNYELYTQLQALISTQERESLLDTRLDVNATVEGASLLHMAVQSEQMDIVQLQIRKGADLNTLDTFDQTPQMCAIEKGNVELVHELQQGSDQSQFDNYDRNAQMIACDHGHVMVARALLESGMKPDVISARGQAALHYAVQNEHASQLLALLLEFGTDLNQTDELGTTALMWAVQLFREDLVRELLQYKARMDIVDVHGGSAQSLALADRSIDILILLLEHGCDLTDDLKNWNLCELYLGQTDEQLRRLQSSVLYSLKKTDE